MNANVNLIRSIIGLVATVLALGLFAYSQIGDLGIYGGCPPAYINSIRFARLDEYPAVDPSLNYVLPVNGLCNFNFFYKPDGTNFLPGGSYIVTYLGADRTTTYGSDIVSFSPNSGHTNGVKVRDFHSPPSTPRGVHGRIYGRINNINYPFPDANLTVFAYHQTLQVHARTNANGYFSFYYTNETSPRLLPVDPVQFHEHYYLLNITGTLNGCSFASTIDNLNTALWLPSNTTDPSNTTYFVNGAEEDRGDLVITPNSCSGD